MKQKPVYEAVISALQDAASDEVYLSPEEFMPVLRKALAKVLMIKVAGQNCGWLVCDG